MYRPVTGSGEGGFLDGFRVGRVRMAHAGGIFGGGPEFHERYRLGNHIGGTGADHVDAENFVGVTVRKDFYHAFGVGAGPGTAERFIGEFAQFIGRTIGFQLLFGAAYAGYFGPGVHYAGNQVVVDMRLLTGHFFGYEYAFFLGFVRDGDLLPLRRSSALFTIPSEADLQSMATMEAMACRLPVVAANIHALPELVHHEENGFLFQPGNSEEMAGYIDRLLEDGRCVSAWARQALRL